VSEIPRKSFRLGSDLILVAATIFATLAVQRHVGATPDRSLAATAELNPSGAASPLDQTAGPRLRWGDILLRTYHQIDEDRLLATAAGVVFYGLLAIFPAITALVSSYALFADASTIQGNLQALALMMPADSFSVVSDQIGRVIAKENSALGLTFIAGLLFAIWSANAGMKAVIDALNVVYDEREKRGFFRLNLVSLGFTTGALVAILVMIGAVIAVPLVLQRLGLGARAEFVVRIGRWPILLMLLLLALAVLYRFGPSRTKPRWQLFSPGATVAATLWLAGSGLLSWYLSNFGNYTAAYGSLGAAIGLMTWMWMSAIIVLCGAEFNSEIERTRDAARGRP
jgi:membrane protein